MTVNKKFKISLEINLCILISCFLMSIFCQKYVIIQKYFRKPFDNFDNGSMVRPSETPNYSKSLINLSMLVKSIIFYPTSCLSKLPCQVVIRNVDR